MSSSSNEKGDLTARPLVEAIRLGLVDFPAGVPVAVAPADAGSPVPTWHLDPRHPNRFTLEVVTVGDLVRTVVESDTDQGDTHAVVCGDCYATQAQAQHLLTETQIGALWWSWHAHRSLWDHEHRGWWSGHSLTAAVVGSGLLLAAHAHGMLPVATEAAAGGLVARLRTVYAAAASVAYAPLHVDLVCVEVAAAAHRAGLLAGADAAPLAAFTDAELAGFARIRSGEPQLADELAGRVRDAAARLRATTTWVAVQGPLRGERPTSRLLEDRLLPAFAGADLDTLPDRVVWTPHLDGCLLLAVPPAAAALLRNSVFVVRGADNAEPRVLLEALHLLDEPWRPSTDLSDLVAAVTAAGVPVLVPA